MVSLFKWTMVSFLGWILGIVLIIVLSGILESVNIKNLQFHVGLGVSLGMSLTQFAILRKYFSVKAGWILFSVLAFTLPFVLVDLLTFAGLMEKTRYSLVVAVVAGAISISFTQNHLLKKNNVQAKKWFAYSCGGWLIALALVFLVEFTTHWFKSTLVVFTLNLLFILAGGLITGLFTGVVLQKTKEELR